jgi:hypothetical protein
MGESRPLSFAIKAAGALPGFATDGPLILISS